MNHHLPPDDVEAMIARFEAENEARVEVEERAGLAEDGVHGTDVRTDQVAFEHLTDLGNARVFATQFGSTVRYCAALGGYLINDGVRWALDDIGEVYRLCERVVQARYHEASLAGTKKQRDAIAGWAKKSEDRARIEATIKLARYQSPIAARASEFDRDPWALNVRNGTLDLRTGELRPHRKEDLITKLAPVTYQSRAVAPAFHALLNRIFARRREIVEFVQRFIGHVLTGLTTEQVLLLLYGVGANGKSVFVEVVRALLGDYAQTATFDTFLAQDRGGTIRNDLARLVGARFVTAIEMSQGGRLDEAVIKQLTGGDRISARFLHKEFFEFTPEFKLVLVSNHRPRIKGTDHAIWRRVLLLPFEIVIPPAERDPLLAQRIINTELSGVLNWALEGCREWQQRGLQAPEAVQSATKEYRHDQDVLAPFLAERCDVNPSATATAKGLYAAYKEWAHETGELHQGKPISQRTFGENLRERGFQPKHTKAGDVWQGLGLSTRERPSEAPIIWGEG